MCVVSMVMDHYRDRWEPMRWDPLPAPVMPGVFPTNPIPPFFTPMAQPFSREEFDQLKRDVEEMKKLLVRAKEYDRKNNEPDCEMAEKADFIRKIADFVGVDLKDVIGTPKEA